LRKARSEARSLSFMDLAAPHDDVLTQKDQANAVFLLHGCGLKEGPTRPESPVAQGHQCRIMQGAARRRPNPQARTPALTGWCGWPNFLDKGG